MDDSKIKYAELRDGKKSKHKQVSLLHCFSERDRKAEGEITNHQKTKPKDSILRNYQKASYMCINNNNTSRLDILSRSQ